MARAPKSRIGLSASPFRQNSIPIAAVMLGSLVPILPFVTIAPVLPSFGLLALISWRTLHRDLWPVWIGAPLGLFDDMFSGQPVGSAMLIWSLVMILFDFVDRRFVWRDFKQEWILASALSIVAICISLFIANRTGGGTDLVILVPQMLFTILCFPLVSRVCAVLDRVRLRR